MTRFNESRRRFYAKQILDSTKSDNVDVLSTVTSANAMSDVYGGDGFSVDGLQVGMDLAKRPEPARKIKTKDSSELTYAVVVRKSEPLTQPQAFVQPYISNPRIITVNPVPGDAGWCHYTVGIWINPGYADPEGFDLSPGGGFLFSVQSGGDMLYQGPVVGIPLDDSFANDPNFNEGYETNSWYGNGAMTWVDSVPPFNGVLPGWDGPLHKQNPFEGGYVNTVLSPTIVSGTHTTKIKLGPGQTFRYAMTFFGQLVGEGHISDHRTQVNTHYVFDIKDTFGRHIHKEYTTPGGPDPNSNSYESIIAWHGASDPSPEILGRSYLIAYNWYESASYQYQADPQYINSPGWAQIYQNRTFGSEADGEIRVNLDDIVQNEGKSWNDAADWTGSFTTDDEGYFEYSYDYYYEVTGPGIEGQHLRVSLHMIVEQAKMDTYSLISPLREEPLELMKLPCLIEVNPYITLQEDACSVVLQIGDEPDYINRRTRYLNYAFFCQPYSHFLFQPGTRPSTVVTLEDDGVNEPIRTQVTDIRPWANNVQPDQQPILNDTNWQADWMYKFLKIQDDFKFNYMNKIDDLYYRLDLMQVVDEDENGNEITLEKAWREGDVTAILEILELDETTNELIVVDEMEVDLEQIECDRILQVSVMLPQ